MKFDVKAYSTAHTHVYYMGGIRQMMQDVRREMGISLRELAKRSGLSYSTVQRWSHGGYGSVTTLMAIADGLGLQVSGVDFHPRQERSK